jgi:hypothetical protein
MQSQESHLSDQELILVADGELTAPDAGRVEKHLAACWACRARKQEIEATIGDVVRAHRRNLDGRLPPPEGPRALLKAQLTQLAESQPKSWQWLPHVSWKFSSAIAAAGFAVFALGFVIAQRWTQRPAARMVVVAVPDPSLTPGATVLVSRGEVCRQSNTKNKAVPVALRRRVFDEYGIRTAEPNAYEVDYLITPALGGADDIHNLWPQSYASTIWNAQVKDALEDHLRDLVCAGELDLSTAQREIATNWIDTYKKYFHTDSPLTQFR